MHMQCRCHYTGKLTNGSVFDSSYDRRKPLTFKVRITSLSLTASTADVAELIDKICEAAVAVLIKCR